MTANNGVVLPADMLAARVQAYGDVDVIRLDRIPMPSPHAGEVLVRVRAAGVGAWDAWVRAGKSALPQPLPLTLGAELAGTVVAVGSNAGPFVSGDQVFGVTNQRFVGADAEYAIAKVRSLAKKPLWLGFCEAAAIPVSSVTAWTMLVELGATETGQRVLIHGAAGNVGRYAVRLAKYFGCHVVATCFGADVEAVRALGADEVIDVSQGSFVGRVKYADLVIDTVGGVTQTASLDVLVPGGLLVSSVSEPDRSLATQRRVRTAFFVVDVTRDRLEALLPLFGSGVLVPLIGEVLELGAIALAHTMLAGAPHRPGKIVLLPAASSSDSDLSSASI
jgi:NADPH:quinone reductase-like Zn-dependent oxidoreductase